MRLFPSPFVYLLNPAAIAVLVVVVATMLCCCQGGDDDYAQRIVSSVRCVWSHRYEQCFCVAVDGNSVGHMAWAPPETCRGSE